jgi:hypothetical protein
MRMSAHEIFHRALLRQSHITGDAQSAPAGAASFGIACSAHSSFPAEEIGIRTDDTGVKPPKTTVTFATSAEAVCEIPRKSAGKCQQSRIHFRLGSAKSFTGCGEGAADAEALLSTMNESHDSRQSSASTDSSERSETEWKETRE